MPRRFLQRYMPNPDTLRRQRSLRFMSRMIGDPGLWVLSRRTVANAFSVGLFSAMLPIPFQMVVAAFGAWVLRCNLPLSVGLVWITNPLTMPLIFYGNYRIGAWLMDTPVREAPARLSTHWIASRMADILPALALGSVVSAIVFAILGNLLVRLVWRWHISRSWKQRAMRRRLRRMEMED
ncbi:MULTISPECIES: DUF2062 domain-containing protein [Halomonadaceae]|jgi:uncharacterized protein (DUF2062 family)|uniref:DUF2062 domain-containing protein n=3 Tax=Billgrantia TaxID=3137761 RepID=A0AAW4YZ97_9GAMM|nr:MULTISPECIES: DUF2062 domain-containing protein [Halomonas]MCE8001457.1 DUF2062 domain-containing protein [Halomonas ethanolica]MCE8012209.1 DUF2062 domain-containing protein [Halomonas desiderata]MCE8024941.1 DUF2062 domain-containing protein [Halomonas aerodenitrificans]MCE8027917.1 DUF2062 domain-containing protein [Halomonas desiderata]MCE8036932.1 DUF2062 domain-containing protein [Halomonas sp. MCCC 1A11062]